jgi:hypothetical protein
MYVDSLAVLHWTSKNEIGKFSFTIEQFRWNKWVKVGDTMGKGGIGENEYSFQTIPHSGKNKFRIKQFNYSDQPGLSGTAEFSSPDLKIKILQNKHKLADELTFNKETLFELFGSNGNIIKKGYGKLIDLKGLERAEYYLFYDDKITEVTKFY